jgi:predicted MFS family arabinose efflux permease
VASAGYALVESTLMDFVPSNERSRWKALESIAAVGWAGSALLGGVVSDERGYSFAFAMTATIQLMGIWILAPLMRIVPVETLSAPRTSTASSGSTDEDLGLETEA